MNDNIVKLVFNAVSSGSGWTDVSKKLKDLLGDSGKLAQGIGSLGQAFGTFGMAAGKAVGMLMQGGVWGFAAEGIKFVINKFELFKDKSEEVKKTLGEQKKAHENMLASITTGYTTALAKIDAEARKRKELIELTNRQTKAQLELQRAQKIMSGDTAGAQWIDDELSKQDGRSAADKADADVSAAEKRVKAAQNALAAAQKASRLSEEKLSNAEDAYRSKNKPVDMVMQSSAGSYIKTTRRDTTEELSAVKAARAESDAAEEKVEAARKALEMELQGLRESRKTRETIRLEQEAAEKKSEADRRKADIDAAKAKEKAEKEATKKFLEDGKRHAVELENERKAQAEKNREEEEQAVREQERKDIAEQSKRRMDALGKEADFYRQRLADSHAAIENGWEVYRDPGQLDQAGDRREKRQKEIDEARFEKDAERLQKRKDWRTADNLSNRDRATRDLLLAKENEKDSKDHLANIDTELKDLIKKLEEVTSI